MSSFVHLKYITQVVTLSPEDFSGNHLLIQIIKLIHQIIIKKHSLPDRNLNILFVSHLLICIISCGNFSYFFFQIYHITYSTGHLKYRLKKENVNFRKCLNVSHYILQGLFASSEMII